MRSRLIARCIAVAALLSPSLVSAAPTAELRVFTDAAPSGDHGWVARPFLYLEERLRTDGQALSKSGAGLRMAPTDWLGLTVWGAHVEKVAAGSHDDLATLDLRLHRRLGPWELALRLGNEGHFPARFYRYRQLHELRLHTAGATPWLQDELRVDSDEGRVTMHNLRAGVALPLGSALTLDLRFDWELSRRGLDTWKGILAPGLRVTSRW